ncbi:MAG: glycosyltransferase [Deltaproteobacteria bacterium]|nr:glycosyltransferase [Deltaproteobacteria bacterium]
MLPAIPEDPPAWGRTVSVSESDAALKVLGETGKLISLHSPTAPWKEAERLADRVDLGESGTVLVLGLGLGYHVLKLLPRLNPEHRVIIVEKEPEVFLAALRIQDLTAVLAESRTTLAVDPDFRKVSRHLLKHFFPGDGQRLIFFGHPPSLRAHNTFYQEVIRRLKPSAPGTQARRGVRQERFRVLIINPDYFLIPEAGRAFRDLGHEVKAVLFDKRRDNGEEVVRRILAEVKACRPDLVFTVNHLGLDREGLLMEFFHRLKVPFVSWYVDSPAIILNLYAGQPSEMAYIFVWDPTYTPEVKALGFQKVFPLPLATDPHIFKPRPASVLAPWENQVAFVGNSLVKAVAEKLARLPASPEFERLFQRLTQAYLDKPFRPFKDVAEKEDLAGHPLIAGLSHTERTDLGAAIIWEATRVHRLGCVEQLAPFKPVIYGDPGWRQLTGGPFRLRPEVNYFDELPLVYGATAVNFNVTSLQMKAAVNQRVFDAPAAGGFLLTDFKPQLDELFQVGREIICYRHPGEIPELTRYYLKADRDRNEIVSRGRRRILAEHTYKHRLRTMVDIIRRTV